MKRKSKNRITYFHLLLIPGAVLLLFSALILCGALAHGLHGQSFSAQEKTVLIISILVFTGTLLYYLLVILPKYREYRRLCEEFSEKAIYQDFVEHAGGLFPGLDSSIHRMDALLDRQNTIQLSTKQAEFLALQNQINPHFLYNTLDAIRSDALIAGLTEISDITEALSKFFRYTITNMEQMVIMRDEIENVKKYFIIQKYRFEDDLNLEINIEDDPETIMQVSCPKLFLQPLVENAIFHGLEPAENRGTINITIDIVGEDLLVRVSDDGIGMPEDVLNKLNESLDHLSVGYIPDDVSRKEGGIALKNVCRRIKLLFGEQYGLHMHSVPGIGTVAEVRLPLHSGS